MSGPQRRHMERHLQFAFSQSEPDFAPVSVYLRLDIAPLCLSVVKCTMSSTACFDTEAKKGLLVQINFNLFSSDVCVKAISRHS